MTEYRFGLAIDTDQARRGVRDLATETRKAGAEFDTTREAARQLAARLAAMADANADELARVTRAADKLADTIGPELAAAIGRSRIDGMVADLRAAGVQFDDIEAEAEAFADVLRRLPAASNAGLRSVADDLDRVDSAARRGSDGIGVGANAFRDLTGPLGDSTGMAWDFAESFEGLGDIAAAAGERLGLSAGAIGKLTTGLAGAGLLIGVGTALWSMYTSKQEAARRSTEDMVAAQQALADGQTEQAVDKIVDAHGDLISTLQKLGYTVPEAIDLIRGQSDALADMEDALTKTGVAGDTYTDAQMRLVTMAAANNVSIDETIVKVRDAQKAWSDAGTEVENNIALRSAVGDYLAAITGEAGDAANNVGDLADQFKDLRDSMDLEESVLDVADAFDDVEDAAQRAWDTAIAGTDDADRAARDYERAQNDLRRSVLDYAAAVKDVPAEKVTEILSLIDAGSLAEAERAFDDLTRDRTVNIRAGGPGLSLTARYMATGGLGRPGDIVGENGRPELVDGQIVTGPTRLARNAVVTGERDTARLLTGPSVVDNSTTIINMPAGVDPGAVQAALRRDRRINGG